MSVLNSNIREPESFFAVDLEPRNITIDIKKTFLHRGLVYGIVYEPDTIDANGDWTSKEEIERAAHAFLPNAVMNVEHDKTNDLDERDVEVVESYIAMTTFNIGDQPIKEGAWVLVSKVNNEELKEAIAKGEIKGYSLEGTAQLLEYVPVANAHDQQSMVVQSLVFSKEKFSSPSAARAWASSHDFKSAKVDETENSFRLRQFDPSSCREGSFRTKGLTDGVKAVMCKRG